MSVLRYVILAGVAMAVAASLAGCNPVLFPKDVPRSQYQRYDELRGRDIPAGDAGLTVAKPDLQERLRPLDQP